MTKDSNKPHAERVCRAVYRIRVAGALEDVWSERSNGMTVVVHKEPGSGATTELFGWLPDQVALMGVLEHLDTYGARLLGFECVDSSAPDSEAVGGPTPASDRQG